MSECRDCFSISVFKVHVFSSCFLADVILYLIELWERRHNNNNMSDRNEIDLQQNDITMREHATKSLQYA